MTRGETMLAHDMSVPVGPAHPSPAAALGGRPRRLRAVLLRLALGCAAILIATAGSAGDARLGVGAAAAQATSPIAAQVPVQEATTGRKLLDYCSAGDASRTAWCEAYITGVVEGMFGTRAFPSRCFKGTPHFAEIRKVVVEYATMSNLEGDDYAMRRPAPLMIRDVLTVMYCG